MDTNTIEIPLSETNEQLERARVEDIDLRAGFLQLPIASSSTQQLDIIALARRP